MSTAKENRIPAAATGQILKDRTDVSRRDFLRLSGLLAFVAAAACSPFPLPKPENEIIPDAPLLHPEDASYIVPKLQRYSEALVPMGEIGQQELTPEIIQAARPVMIQLSETQTRLINLGDKPGSLLMLQLPDQSFIAPNWINGESPQGAGILARLANEEIPLLPVQELQFLEHTFDRGGVDMMSSELQLPFYCQCLQTKLGNGGPNVPLKVIELRPSGTTGWNNGQVLAQVNGSNGESHYYMLGKGHIPSAIRGDQHFMLRMHNLEPTGDILMPIIQDHFDDLLNGVEMSNATGAVLKPIAAVERSQSISTVLLHYTSTEYTGPVIALRAIRPDGSIWYNGYAPDSVPSEYTGLMPSRASWIRALDSLFESVMGSLAKGNKLKLRFLSRVDAQNVTNFDGPVVFKEYDALALMKQETDALVQYLEDAELVKLPPKEMGLFRNSAFSRILSKLGYLNIITEVVIPYIANPLKFLRQGNSIDDAMYLAVSNHYPQALRLRDGDANAWNMDTILNNKTVDGYTALAVIGGNFPDSTSTTGEGLCPFAITPIQQLDGTDALSIKPLFTETEYCEVVPNSTTKDNWTIIFPLQPFDLVPIATDILPSQDEWKEKANDYYTNGRTNLPWYARKLRTVFQYVDAEGQEHVDTTEVLLSAMTDGTTTMTYVFIKRVSSNII